jgi:beta-glucosidase
MKVRIPFLFAVVFGVMLASCVEAVGRDGADSRVADLVGRMTLEEKVGQMTQITLEAVSTRKDDQHVQLDMEKLRGAILKHHVGSILNCGGSANTVDNWREIITVIQDVSTKETRLGIPDIYGIDAIHGVNYAVGATLFPQSIAMAAAGNVELCEQEGRITAAEMRACGLAWNFNPVLGLGRQPLWSRMWETYGEDPYLAAKLGAAYIRGQQGDDMSAPDRVGTCMKHYLGYSVPLSGKDRTPAWIPNRMLGELLVPPFQEAVRAGTPTVMVNSSEINGVPIHSSPYALKTLLRDELGFEGFVVSDWADIINLYTREKVAADNRQAVKMAVTAGVDMSMVPYDYSFTEALIDLVRSGEVPESRIDEAVSRILKVKFDLGLFDDPYPKKELATKFASAESTAINLEAAREAVTLLKNENGLLPLSRDKKVLVTGPTADMLSVLNGGWTITWQGDREDLYPQEKMTVLEAVRQKVGAENVRYVPGTTFDADIDIQAAVAAARQADVVIACVGEPTYCETPGNITDLTLEKAQLNLVNALRQAAKPIVLILIEGRPRVIASIEDAADGIITAYLPGMEGGLAIADIVFGDVNPSGKLPFTYPKYASGFVMYDHRNSETYDVQWPFGHGLSYTTFEYSNLRLSKSEIGVDESLKVSVDVSNTGKRAGKEIVQLYLSDVVRSVTPPVRQLKGFVKIALQPGQKRTVAFVVDRSVLEFVGRENVRVVEPGDFKVSVGNLAGKFSVN